VIDLFYITKKQNIKAHSRIIHGRNLKTIERKLGAFYKCETKEQTTCNCLLGATEDKWTGDG
jgi:hypothetical protein